MRSAAGGAHRIAERGDGGRLGGAGRQRPAERGRAAAGGVLAAALHHCAHSWHGSAGGGAHEVQEGIGAPRAAERFEQFGPDDVAGPAFVDDDQVHTWGHPCSGVSPQQYLVDVQAGIRHHGCVEQDAHRGAVCIRLAIAGAAQLLCVGAGERGVRVEVLPVEHPRVAATETLQVGLPSPAYRTRRFARR